MKRFSLILFFIPVFCFTSGIRSSKWGMSPDEIVLRENQLGNARYILQKTRFLSFKLIYDFNEKEQPKKIIYIFNQHKKLMNITYVFNMHTTEFDLNYAIHFSELLFKGKLSRYHIGWRLGNTGVDFSDNEKERIWKIEFWTLDKKILE